MEPIIKPLTTINTWSIGQRIARFEQYCNAKFRNKYAPLVNSLKHLIPHEAVIFDVGANHGRFAKPLAQIHGGSCMVYAFEPLEYNYTLARSVLRSFPNIKVFPLALSDKHGSAILFVPVKKKSKRINHVTAHLGKQGYEQYFAFSAEKDVFSTEIQTETLDNFMASEKLSRLDFIKIDVEGAENNVFRGGLNTLKKHKPVIFCEVSEMHTKKQGLSGIEAISPLLDLGYYVHTLDMKRIDVNREVTFSGDYIFIHPEIHKTK